MQDTEKGCIQLNGAPNVNNSRRRIVAVKLSTCYMMIRCSAIIAYQKLRQHGDTDAYAVDILDAVWKTRRFNLQ